MTKRREFTRDQKAAIVRRATVEGVIRCEGCSLAVKTFEIDHIIPEGLRPDADKARKLTITEGQLLGKACCHRGPEGKTAQDVQAIAKAKRAEAKHAGISRKKQKISSRGFGSSRPQKAGKPSLPPRLIYQNMEQNNGR